MKSEELKKEYERIHGVYDSQLFEIEKKIADLEEEKVALSQKMSDELKEIENIRSEEWRKEALSGKHKSVNFMKLPHGVYLELKKIEGEHIDKYRQDHNGSIGGSLNKILDEARREFMKKYKIKKMTYGTGEQIRI